MKARDALERTVALDDPAERVLRLCELLVEAEQARQEVQAARDDTIRELHTAGYRVPDIVRRTGITRGRVHQILNRTR